MEGNENPADKKSKSGVGKAFEELTNRLDSALNPPLADKSQEPLKNSLDKAFDTLRVRFSCFIDKVVECPDGEMLNVIQMALAWYKDIDSIEEALEFVKLSLSLEERNNIEHISKDHWLIKTEEALKELSDRLVERHRTLRYKR